MIWSPRVPVFRDDVSLALVEEVIPTNQPNLFDQVALVNMVTSCAVNLGHYKRQGGAVSTAEAEMRRRIELVSDWPPPRARRCTGHHLEILLPKCSQVLVLGAWGCGVFQWPPGTVAR